MQEENYDSHKDAARLSAKARINRAIRLTEVLTEELIEIKETRNMRKMKDIRDTLNSLCQSVHEYNAYQNINQVQIGKKLIEGLPKVTLWRRKIKTESVI